MKRREGRLTVNFALAPSTDRRGRMFVHKNPQAAGYFMVLDEDRKFRKITISPLFWLTGEGIIKTFTYSIEVFERHFIPLEGDPPGLWPYSLAHFDLERLRRWEYMVLGRRKKVIVC